MKKTQQRRRLSCKRQDSATKKTLQRRRLPDDKKLSKVRPVRPFVARGSAPFFAPPPFEAFPESSRRGACPHSDRLTPSIHQSGASCPTFSTFSSTSIHLLTKRVGIQAEAPGEEIQAGDSLSGPRKNLQCSNPASLTRPAEIVAAWSVQDSVRRAGSGEDGGGECGEGGVVVWMAWLLRCGCGDAGCSKITTAKEKRLTQRIAARMNHTYSL